MDDLISRQAAIDALDEQIRQCDKALSAFDISMKDEYAVKVERASLVAFRETFEYMPSAQQWIPCSERLPYAGEYGGSDIVLTTCGYRDVEDTSVRWIRLLYFNGGNWYCPTGETYKLKVYAWMPLPAPAKIEG